MEDKKATSKSKKHRVRIDPIRSDGSIPEEIPSMPPEQAEKRLRVVRELLETERAHVSSLGIAISNYYEPLTEISILPKTTIRAIFSNLEVIRNWNQTFLACLEAELECGETLGGVFLQMVCYYYLVNHFSLS